MPLGAVEDSIHLLARIRHLLLDADLVRIEVHQASGDAQPTRAEKALVDPRRPQDVRAEIPDEGHRREPQHPACHEHRNARGIGERRRDEQAVRDDYQLALGAKLEREVVGGRARVEGDGLALVDHRRRRAGDRALPLDLET